MATASYLSVSDFGRPHMGHRYGLYKGSTNELFFRDEPLVILETNNQFLRVTLTVKVNI